MPLFFRPAAPVAPNHSPYMLRYPIFPYVGPRLNLSQLSMRVISGLFDLGDD